VFPDVGRFLGRELSDRRVVLVGLLHLDVVLGDERAVGCGEAVVAGQLNKLFRDNYTGGPRAGTELLFPYVPKLGVARDAVAVASFIVLVDSAGPAVEEAELGGEAGVGFEGINDVLVGGVADTAEEMRVEPPVYRRVVPVPLGTVVRDFAFPGEEREERLDVWVFVFVESALEGEVDGAGFEVAGVGPVDLVPCRAEVRGEF